MIKYTKKLLSMQVSISNLYVIIQTERIEFMLHIKNKT